MLKVKGVLVIPLVAAAERVIDDEFIILAMVVLAGIPKLKVNGRPLIEASVAGAIVTEVLDAMVAMVVPD